MLPVLGLETSLKLSPDPCLPFLFWAQRFYLRLCQHCIAELSAVVPQLAPKQLAEGWKIDVVFGQHVQDDRFQDTSRGAYTGMDAQELLQRETSLLCSNGHSLKCLLPVCEDQLFSTLPQVQVNSITHLFSGWRCLRGCFEQNLLGTTVFQRKFMACLFFSTKQLPKSGKLGVYVSCVPLQRNQGSKSFRLDQHYLCHPVHWWLVLNSGIAGMG